MNENEQKKLMQKKTKNQRYNNRNGDTQWKAKDGSTKSKYTNGIKMYMEGTLQIKEKDRQVELKFILCMLLVKDIYATKEHGKLGSLMMDKIYIKQILVKRKLP